MHEYTKPLIYVLVPIYNVEAYIERCLDSILNQSYENFRVLIINDGSNDLSEKICKRYVENDYRIKLINQENLGVSVARNRALLELEAMGYFETDGLITFVDGDDCICNDYLEFLYEQMVEHNADIVQCGYYYVKSNNILKCRDKSTESIVYTSKQALESMCYNLKYDVALWGKLYKADVLKEVCFPCGKIYEDTARAYLIAEKASVIVINMTPKYYYYQNVGSIAHATKFDKNRFDLIDAGDEFANYVLEKYPDLSDAANAKKAYVRLSTLSQMVNCNYYDSTIMEEHRYSIKQIYQKIILNPKVARRTKIGILALLLGKRVYWITWKIYYSLVR